MQVVPLQPIASQTLNVQVNGQSCQLNVYQKFYGLFMDVYSGGTLVIAGVQCENLNRIVRSLYLGFQGDFAFFDTQGSADPSYTGLGSRYLLLYFPPVAGAAGAAAGPPTIFTLDVSLLGGPDVLG